MFEVADAIRGWGELLVEHHREFINLSELDGLHEMFGDGDYPPDGWSSTEVMALLTRLPQIACEEFDKCGSADIQKTKWYRALIGFLNDTFPSDDGVWIDFEGELCDFLPQLLNQESGTRRNIAQLSDSDAIWLGHRAVLAAQSWSAHVPPMWRRGVWIFPPCHMW